MVAMTTILMGKNDDIFSTKKPGLDPVLFRFWEITTYKSGSGPVPVRLTGFLFLIRSGPVRFQKVWSGRLLVWSYYLTTIEKNWFHEAVKEGK